MKRPKKRPDHRCRPRPVFRDVAPGHVPVPIHDTDGSPCETYDLPTDLVEILEQGARKHGLAFNELVTKSIAQRIANDLRKLEGD